jgi:beta-galactosidase
MNSPNDNHFMLKKKDPKTSEPTSGAAKATSPCRENSKFFRINLNSGWEFSFSGKNDWIPVSLPHTPKLSDLNANDMWVGDCVYERFLTIESPMDGKAVWLRFEGIMNKSEVLLDGESLGIHAGGYLPFIIDLTSRLKRNSPHRLTVKVSNRSDPDIPPGKPLELLDFSWHGGIYRGVHLEVRDDLYISDEIASNTVAGGGIFVTYPRVSDRRAEIQIQTEIVNRTDFDKSFALEYLLRCGGRVVAEKCCPLCSIAPNSCESITSLLQLESPQLWSPRDPNLYDLEVRVIGGGLVCDSQRVRIGIRRFSFSRSNGLLINGERFRLTGTNRHQEHPYVGYAVPDAADYRDALRIKNSGFDYVRLSHYPQSPAFLDACDELGIAVMNCIPGWQYFGGDRFQDACEINARNLVRRDRNHPSVFLWELSLNETNMSPAFMERMHRAGHEEYPGDQFYTCGWMDSFDVYLRSRQHGGLHTYENGETALVVAEYGDWEYFAMNEGFAQQDRSGLMDARFSSRQFRRDGEIALLRQAQNFSEAFNENLTTPAVACGQWAFCDYTRGYDPLRAAMGVRDIFRLPKFSHYFYRSQRSFSPPKGRPWEGGYMVFIASYWTAASSLSVTVFSNTDEVELYLNDDLISRQRPSISKHTQFLKHPPFVFDVGSYVRGTLKAIGYVAGTPVATHQVSTPGEPVAIEIDLNTEGVPPQPNPTDLLFLHVRVVDESGSVVPNFNRPIRLACEGSARVIDPQEFLHLEGGIASTLVEIRKEESPIVLRAFCEGLPMEAVTINLA